MLAWGADVNAKDSAGYTPLHLAVKEFDKNKGLSTIRKLIFKGAHPNVRDSLNRRPVDFLDGI